jgi:hypothetical protein
VKLSAGTAATLIAGALVVALVVAFATRGSGRDDGPGGPHAALVADALPKVERAVALPFKRPPTVEVRSREEVRRYVEQQLDDSLARAQIAGQEAVLKQLGLIPDTMSLRGLLLQVLPEQIAGYYDPRTKALYIVEGADDQILATTVAHELVHALQDQYVNLDSIMRAGGDDDRLSAAQAVIEGQATFDHLRIVSGGEIPAIPGGWQGVRDIIRQERGRWPAFAAAPLVVQEMLVFPYLTGFEFVRATRDANGRAADLFADIPTSTEQIMHPARGYLGTRDTVTRVTLPPLPGTTVYENTLGEFPTRLFLYEHLRDQQGAIAGADGWDGDRYAVIRTPRGEGIVWVSVWDSSTDGAEFYDLLDRTTDRRYGPSSARTVGAPQAGAGMATARVYSVGGRAISVRTGEIDGRPVVVYANLPAGEDPLAIDPSRIRLGK